jgi:hypothetical protein
MRPVFTGDPSNPQDLLDFEIILRAWEVANPGPSGNVGPAGADGTDGLPGADGADGAQGMDGANGLQGIQGIPGDAGLDGADGNDGAAGLDGADGVDGAVGPAGPVGPIDEFYTRPSFIGHNLGFAGPVPFFGAGGLLTASAGDFTTPDEFQLQANFTGRMILDISGTFSSGTSADPQRVWLLPRVNNVFAAYGMLPLYFPGGSVVTPYINGTLRVTLDVVPGDIIDVYSFPFGPVTTPVLAQPFLSAVRAERIS